MKFTSGVTAKVSTLFSGTQLGNIRERIGRLYRGSWPRRTNASPGSTFAIHAACSQAWTSFTGPFLFCDVSLFLRPWMRYSAASRRRVANSRRLCPSRGRIATPASEHLPATPARPTCRGTSVIVAACVFHCVDDRPEIVDVAMGLLDAPCGARAEEFVSWTYDKKFSWRECVIGGWREGHINAVQSEVKTWQERE